MPRKKKTTAEYPPNWQVSTTWYWNRRVIEPGTELSIKGIKGRCRFVKHVIVLGDSTPGGNWVYVKSEYIDVLDKNQHFRSVPPQKIKTVHRKNKTRANVA